jgi:hypothetical protein
MSKEKVIEEVVFLHDLSDDEFRAALKVAHNIGPMIAYFGIKPVAIGLLVAIAAIVPSDDGIMSWIRAIRESVNMQKIRIAIGNASKESEVMVERLKEAGLVEDPSLKSTSAGTTND